MSDIPKSITKDTIKAVIYNYHNPTFPVEYWNGNFCGWVTIYDPVFDGETLKYRIPKVSENTMNDLTRSEVAATVEAIQKYALNHSTEIEFWDMDRGWLVCHKPEFNCVSMKYRVAPPKPERDWDALVGRTVRHRQSNSLYVVIGAHNCNIYIGKATILKRQFEEQYEVCQQC